MKLLHKIVLDFLKLYNKCVQYYNNIMPESGCLYICFKDDAK